MRKIWLPILLCVALFLAACEAERKAVGTDEDQIRLLIDDLFYAIKTGNHGMFKKVVSPNTPSLDNESAFKVVSSLMQDVQFELSDIVIEGENASAELEVSFAFKKRRRTLETSLNFTKTTGRWLIISPMESISDQ